MFRYSVFFFITLILLNVNIIESKPNSAICVALHSLYDDAHGIFATAAENSCPQYNKYFMACQIASRILLENARANLQTLQQSNNCLPVPSIIDIPLSCDMINVLPSDIVRTSADLFPKRELSDLLQSIGYEAAGEIRSALQPISEKLMC